MDNKREEYMNTYDKAKQAIDDMYGDDSFSKEDCIDILQSLRDEIDILLDVLGE